MLKPPVNQLQVSVRLIFPPGPSGPGLISASSFHVPTNAASFLCAGLGWGVTGCCVTTVIPLTRVKASPRTIFRRLDMCGSLNRRFDSGWAGSDPIAAVIESFAGVLPNDNDRLS